MADPHFWGERSADSSPRPITDFTNDGSATQHDPDTSPHTIPALAPGVYDLYVSEGSSGTKKGPTSYEHKAELALDFPNAIAAWGITYLDANPVLQALRTADSTTQDFDSSEVLDGPLASFSNGGDVDIAILYDQSGNTRDGTPPSGSSEPNIVSGGTVVTNGNGEPAADFASGEQLTASMPQSAAFTVALRADPANAVQQLATVDGLNIRTDGSDIIAKFSRSGGNVVVIIDNTANSYSYNLNDPRGMTEYDGTLYITDKDSGVVTKWDESDVTQASTVNSDPVQLVVYDGDMYIAHYTGNGDAVWSFDGSTWGAISTPIGWLEHLTVADGFLWAGNSNETHKWDGSSWTQVVSIGSLDLAMYNDDPHICDRNGDEVYNIAGGSGSALAFPSTNPAQAMTYNGYLWVGCTDFASNIYFWDGASWTQDTYWNNNVSEDVKDFWVYGGKLWATTNGGVYYKDGTNDWVQKIDAGSAPYGNRTQNFTEYGPDLLVSDHSGEVISRIEGDVTVEAREPRGSGSIPIVVGIDSSTLAVRVDGNETTTSFTISRTQTGTIRLSDGTDPLDGTIRRLLVWDELKSASDRDSIASQL